MTAPSLRGLRFLLLVAVFAGPASAIDPASAGSANCPRDNNGGCANPALAQTTQKATLALAQPQINHNFCPYLPANSNVERLYPAHDVVFSQPLN